MPFFSLPGELRNAIYDQLIYPESSTLFVPKCTSTRDLIATVLSSPIYRVSRQFRNEVIQRLLAAKKVKFYDANTAIRMLKYLGKDACENLRDVSIIVIDTYSLTSTNSRDTTIATIEELTAEVLKLKGLQTLDLLYRGQRSDWAQKYNPLKEMVVLLKSRGVDATARISKLENPTMGVILFTADHAGDG
jgi:hypothetical protein